MYIFSGLLHIIHCEAVSTNGAGYCREPVLKVNEKSI